MWKRRNRGGASVPEWTEPRQARRVLIETPDGAVGWTYARMFARRGWDAAVCPGPAQLPAGRCPLLAGERCSAVEGADAIVFAMSLGDAESRALLAAQRPGRSGKPLVVEITKLDAAEHEYLVRDATVVSTPVVGDELVDAVESAAFTSARP